MRRLRAAAKTVRFAPAEHPRLRAALSAGSVLRFDDPSESDPYDGLLNTDGPIPSIDACMAAPLLVGGQAVGILTLDALDPRGLDGLSQADAWLGAALLSAAQCLWVLRGDPAIKLRRLVQFARGLEDSAETQRVGEVPRFEVQEPACMQPGRRVITLEHRRAHEGGERLGAKRHGAADRGQQRAGVRKAMLGGERPRQPELGRTVVWMGQQGRVPAALGFDRIAGILRDARQLGQRARVAGCRRLQLPARGLGLDVVALGTQRSGDTQPRLEIGRAHV